jgi:hypothetical protein
MKKIYQFTILVLAFVFNASVFAQTTCSLNPVFIASAKNGIFPDSATNFIQGTVGLPYAQNITVKVPKDTIALGQTLCFTRIELSTPAGFTNFNLPPGLSFLSGPTVTNNAGVYRYPGNANSCSIISGIPTTAGTWTVQFRVAPFLSLALGSCPNTPNYNGGTGTFSAPQNLTYYIIKINPNTVGIKEEVSSKSMGLNNIPNPFVNSTSIKFNVQDEASAKVVIHNMLGQQVYTSSFQTKLGENELNINTSDWNSGVYFYTVKYKQYSETKRMILASNR